jgi:hypothetical protein
MFEPRNYSQLCFKTYKVLFIFLLISCHKNHDSIDGTMLTTDEILNYLPPEYLKETDLHYLTI